MHNVSSTYSTIIAGEHTAEWKAVVNGVTHTDIKDLRFNRAAFSNTPSVGCCVSGSIKLTLLCPVESIPKMAQIKPYVRITNGVLTSEWLQKGVYYIDSRSQTKNEGVNWLTLDAYDAMRKAEQDCPVSGFPRTDLSTVNLIASKLGVSVDSSVAQIVNKSYMIQAPFGYCCREVLGYIGAMYAGNWIIDDFGKLKLIVLNGFPPETNYLINNAGYAITFGGVRILV